MRPNPPWQKEGGLRFLETRMFRFDFRHIAAALAVLMVVLPGVALAGGQCAPLGGWVKHGLSGQAYAWQAGSC